MPSNQCHVCRGYTKATEIRKCKNCGKPTCKSCMRDNQICYECMPVTEDEYEPVSEVTTFSRRTNATYGK